MPERISSGGRVDQTPYSRRSSGSSNRGFPTSATVPTIHGQAGGRTALDSAGIGPARRATSASRFRQSQPYPVFGANTSDPRSGGAPGQSWASQRQSDATSSAIQSTQTDVPWSTQTHAVRMGAQQAAGTSTVVPADVAPGGQWWAYGTSGDGLGPPTSATQASGAPSAEDFTCTLMKDIPLTHIDNPTENAAGLVVLNRKNLHEALHRAYADGVRKGSEGYGGSLRSASATSARLPPCSQYNPSNVPVGDPVKVERSVAQVAPAPQAPAAADNGTASMDVEELTEEKWTKIFEEMFCNPAPFPL